MTQEELISATKKIGMECVAEAIKLISNKNVNLIPNPEELKTYYSFPNRSDVLIFLKNGKKFF